MFVVHISVQGPFHLRVVAVERPGPGQGSCSSHSLLLLKMKALVLLEEMVCPPACPGCPCHTCRCLLTSPLSLSALQDGDRQAVRVEDVPTPTLRTGRHVLVRVSAAALNHRDEWMRMVYETRRDEERAKGGREDGSRGGSRDGSRGGMGQEEGSRGGDGSREGQGEGGMAYEGGMGG